jgi:hypothetical protein
LMDLGHFQAVFHIPLQQRWNNHDIFSIHTSNQTLPLLVHDPLFFCEPVSKETWKWVVLSKIENGHVMAWSPWQRTRYWPPSWTKYEVWWFPHCQRPHVWLQDEK